MFGQMIGSKKMDLKSGKIANNWPKLDVAIFGIESKIWLVVT